MGNLAEDISKQVQEGQVHTAAPELVDAIPVPADKARGFAHQILRKEDPYAELNDDRAYALAESWLSTHSTSVQLSSLEEVFPSTDVLIDYIAQAPLGKVLEKDEVSGNQTLAPLLEASEAKVIRDRMTASGILPIFISENGQIVCALRVDENCENNLQRIVSDDLATVVRELDRLNPEKMASEHSLVILPVSTKSFATIQAASLDSAVREEHFVRSCDAYFTSYIKEQGLNLQMFELGKLYPGGEATTRIIEQMNFQPFIALPAKSTENDKEEFDTATKRALYGNRISAGVSIFDDAMTPAVKPTGLASVKQTISAEDKARAGIRDILDLGRDDGFLPLKLERDGDNNPIIYLGFRAYEQGLDGAPLAAEDGSFRKTDWSDLSQEDSLKVYLIKFQAALKEHLPNNLKLEDVRLVPIPNAQFDNLCLHIADANKRKSTLKIIERTAGDLNLIELVEWAAKQPKLHDIHLNMFSSGPCVRVAIGGVLVKAPFVYSDYAFVRTLQAAAIMMSKSTPNYRSTIAGHISFTGAEPRDFAKFEEYRARGESMPRTDNTLTYYPAGLDGMSLRGQYIRTHTGGQIVFRLHRLGKTPPDISELNLSPKTKKDLEAVLRINDGVVLVVGPTGSGKTTLLGAQIMQINDGTKTIATVEDPVEYELPNVAQIEVDDKAGLTKDIILDALLRSTPDVIVAGEIRNKNEADIAIRAGMTGHLVYSTLHTHDAPGAIERLVNLDLERSIIINAVKAVVAQRLIPRFAGVKNSLDYKPDTSLLERYDCRSELEKLIGIENAFDKPIWVLRRNSSLPASRNIFDGRAPIHEILIPGPKLQELIMRDRVTKADILKAIKEEDNPEVVFTPMVVSAIDLVLAGQTSLKAIHTGQKLVPYEQFRIYAHDIVAHVKAWQNDNM